MPKHTIEQIRNIALCGHGHSGKTTLVDKLLLKTGAINRQASVTDGTSVCDFDEEEKQHKYSVEASVVHCEHAGKRFNFIDTPGYPDFIGQTIGALRGVDTAAIVINAHAGIEVNTRRVFEELIKGGYVAQKFVPPGERRDSSGAGEPFKVDLRLYVYGGHALLLAARLYKGQTTNFRTAGGGFAPVLELRDGAALLESCAIPRGIPSAL